MKCPRCNQKLRRSKKDPSFGLCDHCRKKYRWIEKEKSSDAESKSIPAASSGESNSPSMRTPSKGTSSKRTSSAIKKTKQNQKRRTKQRIFLCFLALLLIIALVFGFGKLKDKLTGGNSPLAKDFDKITLGMSYKELTDLMGSKGTNISPSQASDIDTAMYQWTDKETNGNITIMIQNDSVITKTQSGIMNPDSSAKITLDAYDKVENGMSYDDVVSLIGGRGILASDSSSGGFSTQMYIWYGKDGISNAVITFQDDAVFSKTQLGLE